MRQIKFRGKDLATDKWVYGDLIENQGRFFIYHSTSETTVKDDDDNKITIVATEVDNNTVGQFSGLRDNNGKGIYENDIFTVNGKYPKVVKFVPEQAAFCVANIDDLDKDYIYPWRHPSSDWWNDFKREIIIIGNIHDNPDLLDNEKSESYDQD